MHCGAQTVSEPISSTYEYLLTHYGPLLTLKHLAEVMHTTPNGMRMAIARKRQPLAIALANAKRHLGRRVYFEARLVAEIIDQGIRTKPNASTTEKKHSTKTNVSLPTQGHSLPCI